MQLRLGGALSYIALGPAEVSADTTGESGVGPAQSPAGTSPTTPQPESRPEPTAVSSSGAPDASAFPAASTGSDGSSAASASVAEGTNGGSNSSASRPAGPEAVPPDSPAEIAADSSAPGAPAGTAAAAPLDTAQPRRAVLASAPHGLRAPSVLAGLLLAGGLAAVALVGFGRRARGAGQ
jgi:hypothetical protein